MPRIAIDHSNTIIYKFVCKDLTVTDVYTGHTTHFIKRKNCHKTACNNENNKYHNLKIYQTIRANGGWDNWTMLEVEKYPCKDVNEATAREQYWYERLNSTMNSIRPALTEIERENYNKLYYEENKIAIVERKKIYYSQNKIEIAQMQKNYREQNKSRINEKKAIYREQNRELINTKQNAKYAEKNATRK